MLGEWRDHHARKKQEHQKQQQQLHSPTESRKAGEDPDQQQATSGLVDNGSQGPKVRVQVVRTGHKASEKANGRERLCKHKYSSYCVDDVLTTKDDKDETTTMMGAANTTDTLMNISSEGMLPTTMHLQST